VAAGGTLNLVLVLLEPTLTNVALLPQRVTELVEARMDVVRPGVCVTSNSKPPSKLPTISVLEAQLLGKGLF
jgi:hypothetical protein